MTKEKVSGKSYLEIRSDLTKTKKVSKVYSTKVSSLDIKGLVSDKLKISKETSLLKLESLKKEYIKLSYSLSNTYIDLGLKHHQILRAMLDCHFNAVWSDSVDKPAIQNLNTVELITIILEMRKCSHSEGLLISKIEKSKELRK